MAESPRTIHLQQLSDQAMNALDNPSLDESAYNRKSSKQAKAIRFGVPLTAKHSTVQTPEDSVHNAHAPMQPRLPNHILQQTSSILGREEEPPPTEQTIHLPSYADINSFEQFNFPEDRVDPTKLRIQNNLKVGVIPCEQSRASLASSPRLPVTETCVVPVPVTD